MRIELNCAECGENRFDLGEGNEDAAVICCNVCGHKIGTLADLKERIAAEVMKRVKRGTPEPKKARASSEGSAGRDRH